MTKRIYPSPGKIYTKSEIAALVAAGQNTEVFHHATMGIFNVSLARDIIERFPTRFPIYCIAFSQMSAPPELAIPQAQVMDWIFSQREICPKRLAELTDEQLDDPAIDLITEAGEHFLIDGIHRIAARYKRGMPDYRTYWMKFWMCPRVPPEQALTHKYRWGEMDVRDGKLVKR